MDNRWLNLLMTYGWLIAALVVSFLWGKRSGDIHRIDNDRHPRWTYFFESVSNFVGSFAGWCCAYALVVRINGAGPDLRSLNGVDIFLFLAATLGISGRFAETIHRFIDAMGSFIGALAKKVVA
jgi:hypothetical protein